MGRPRGSIHARVYFKGLQVTERFDGDTPLDVVIDARAPGTVDGYYEGSWRLDTNGGTLRVPVHYVLTLPPLPLLFLLFRTMLYGALGGLLLRLSYGLVNPDFGWNWLTRYEGAMQLEPWRLNSWLPVLAGAVGGVEFLRRARKTAPKALQPLLPIVAIFGSVVGIWIILALGHWVLWGLGDFVLHPLALTVGQHAFNAPQWWGLSGIIIGFFHGLGRVLVALGKPWGFYLAPALLFPILLILMIHAASFSG